jgi:lipopolysaccharide export system protein LptA
MSMLNCYAAELAQNSKSPIEILSDEVRYLNVENKAIFAGDVVATQDDLVVKSKTMEVIFEKKEGKGAENAEKSSVKYIYFNDNVDIKNKTDHATASKGEYNVEKGVFILRNNVVLEQDGSVLTGDELIHIKATGESLLKSNNKTNRVKAHIVQKGKEK